MASAISLVVVVFLVIGYLIVFFVMVVFAVHYHNIYGIAPNGSRHGIDTAERKGQRDRGLDSVYLIFLVLLQRVKTTSMVFKGEWRVISLAGYKSYYLSQRFKTFNIISAFNTKAISKQM